MHLTHTPEGTRAERLTIAPLPGSQKPTRGEEGRIIFKGELAISESGRKPAVSDADAAVVINAMTLVHVLRGRVPHAFARNHWVASRA